MPGLGLLVAGPIAAALAGAGAGAVAGGAIGALVGAGIPEERVKEYESGLKKGGIVMGVKPRTPEDRTYFDREWEGRAGQARTVGHAPGGRTDAGSLLSCSAVPAAAQQKPGTETPRKGDDRSSLGTRSVTGTVKKTTDKGLVVVGRETGQKDKEWAFVFDAGYSNRSGRKTADRERAAGGRCCHGDLHESRR